MREAGQSDFPVDLVQNSTGHFEYLFPIKAIDEMLRLSLGWQEASYELKYSWHRRIQNHTTAKIWPKLV